MLLLVFTREQRVSNIKLVQDAAKTPHIDGTVVGYAENDLGSSIEARLNVCIDFFVRKAATAEVNDLDSRLIDLSEKDVLRL